MKGRQRGLAGILLATLAAAGCARAIKEPPTLSALGGLETPPGTPSRVNELLAQAEVLYTARDPEDVRQAARLYLEAARADPARTEGLVGSVRALSWLIDHTDNAAQRDDDALLAVQAAQWCERIAPASPACAYWLGAALGLQARERPSTGLDALPQIEAAFKKAAAGDPRQEHGGPDRALALLYLRAPGWPTGPGDPDLGLTHARRAQETSPDHPLNLMALGEALAATEDAAGSRQAYKRALELALERDEQGDPDATEWIEQAHTALSIDVPKMTPRRP